MTTTWNPADLSGITPSGSNLIATANVGTGAAVRSIDRVASGKYYWEATINVGTANPTGIGICTAAPLLANLGNNNLLTTNNFCIYYHNNTVYRNGVQLSGVTPGAPVNGNVIGIALDADNRLIWFRLGAAGNWNGNAANNPGGLGGVDISSLMGPGVPVYAVASAGATNDQWTANFGASVFSGAVPSGFTSGFPSGTAPPLNELVTQMAAEVWGTSVPAAMLTQAAVEVWGTPNTWMAESGIIRETLLASTSPFIRTSGLVREVLRSTGTGAGTYLATDGVVREVLRSGVVAAASASQARVMVMA